MKVVAPKAKAAPRKKVAAPKESLADSAYRLIEEMIVTLELKPGSSMSEGWLSTRTGIGRTPIREALKRLEQQRLVISLPRKGLIVRDMNVAEHFAMLEVLRPLDRLIAGKAARWATADQRTALKACAMAMTAAAKKKDLREYLRHDQECDRIIYQAARNPFAIDAVAPLYSHSRRFWCSFSQAADLVHAAQLHAKLMTSVAEGDAEWAAQASDALIDYLEEFGKTLIGMV